MRKMIAMVLTAGLLAATTTAQTVSVSLDSAQNGQTVSPGTTIDWSISFSVSAGDNAGLALLVVDLVQDGGNPETLDLPPADSVPAAMSNFSRPNGISNPGESDPTSGYTGVQRGAAGALNLVQIGGGQNTFGAAQSPGTGIAENAIVAGGIGQSGTVTLASGSFAAPSTDGTYTFDLANAAAGTLSSVQAPPAVSPVTGAQVSTSGSITFSVAAGSGCSSACDVTGGDADVDDNCAVNLTDLALVLTNFGSATATHGDGDTDFDGDVDLTDLANLLQVFGTVCP